RKCRTLGFIDLFIQTLPRVLVRLETKKRRMPDAAVVGELPEANLAHHCWLAEMRLAWRRGFLRAGFAKGRSCSRQRLEKGMNFREQGAAGSGAGLVHEAQFAMVVIHPEQ